MVLLLGAGQSNIKCHEYQVKEDAGETRKKRFVNLKRVVWHEGFKCVLESIIQYSKTGCWTDCGDQVSRWLFPLILILSADYEEQ